MATPSTAVTRYELSMSYAEFSLLANRRGYIGLRAAPPIAVALQAAKFLRINVESLLGKIEDTLRAPKAAYKRDDFEWTEDQYATEDHGVEEPLDDRILKIYGDILRAEQIHTQRAINRLLQAYEQSVASALFDTGMWTGAALTTAVSTPWSTLDTSTPITDVDNAIEKVKASCGMRPNALIVSDYALRKLKRTSQVQDLLKYSGQDDPKNLATISALQELFQLEQILVGDGFKNTSDPGQTASFARLWDTTMAMVARVATDTGLTADLEDPEPCVARTIMWSDENAPLPGADDTAPGVIIEEYRDELHRGGVIRARNDRVVKVVHVEAGYLLTNVTS